MRYLIALLLLSVTAFGGTNDWWLEWPDDADQPTFGPVKERELSKGVYKYPPHSKDGTFGYTPENPAPEWYKQVIEEAPEGWEILTTAWVKSNGFAVQSITAMTNLAVKAEQEAIAASNAVVQAEINRQALLAAYAVDNGALITALQSRLLVCSTNYTLPVDFDVVMGDLLAATLAGTLTADQKEAKADVKMIYDILTEKRMMEDEDIADTWLWMQENQ